MTNNKDNQTTVEHKPDPFISQNVWLKRLGLIILLTGLGYSIHPIITTIILILTIVTYVIKQIKDFIKNLWIS